MSTSSTCPRCGHANPPNARFCTSCASQLAFPPGPYEGPQQPQHFPPTKWSGSSLRYWNIAQTERTKSLDRTKIGLLLLIAGIPIGALPYVTYIGVILSIVGVIMVIIGRVPFGTSHSNYAIFSVAIYCVGAAIGSVAAFSPVFTSAMLRGSSQAAAAQELVSAFNELIIGVLVGSAVIGVAYVIFTYALQDSAGRVLLYIAFATLLVFQVLLAYIISPQVAGAVKQSFSSGTFDPTPLRDLQAQLRLLELLNLVPAAIFAIAYYRAFSRIKNGEVPPKTPVESVAPSSGSTF